MKTCCALEWLPHEEVSQVQPLRDLGVDVEHREPGYQMFCRYDATTSVVVDGVEFPCCAHHAEAHAAFLRGSPPGWLPARPVRWGSPSCAASRDAEHDSERLYLDRRRAILERGERDVRARPDALFGWARRTPA